MVGEEGISQGASEKSLVVAIVTKRGGGLVPIQVQGLYIAIGRILTLSRGPNKHRADYPISHKKGSGFGTSAWICCLLRFRLFL